MRPRRFTLQALSLHRSQLCRVMVVMVCGAWMVLGWWGEEGEQWGARACAQRGGLLGSLVLSYVTCTPFDACWVQCFAVPQTAESSGCRPAGHRLQDQIKKEHCLIQSGREITWLRQLSNWDHHCNGSQTFGVLSFHVSQISCPLFVHQRLKIDGDLKRIMRGAGANNTDEQPTLCSWYCCPGPP